MVRVGTGSCDSGTRSRRYWRWVTATASRAGGFADILKHAISDAMNASKNAEKQMTAQVQGKADLVDVVTAISSAETSLQTVMAVRDQAIAAYQQVMQTPM